ncbi:unnamed protein product [Spirodela intermedia]|uniref:Uncharacterized protein n=1 Tax=Spirodela intermedia TaxID=51605 RepID=A0A7I8KSV9_SPIIN|nr:unnamed protein product [Spirodela intermedia]
MKKFEQLFLHPCQLHRVAHTALSPSLTGGAAIRSATRFPLSQRDAGVLPSLSLSSSGRKKMKKMNSILWVLSCGGHNSLRTESLKGIEEILRSGLAPIIEEDPEIFSGDDEEEVRPSETAKTAKNASAAERRRWTAGISTSLTKHRSSGILSIYVRFMNDFASKPAMVGLSRF